MMLELGHPAASLLFVWLMVGLTVRMLRGAER